MVASIELELILLYNLGSKTAQLFWPSTLEFVEVAWSKWPTSEIVELSGEYIRTLDDIYHLSIPDRTPFPIILRDNPQTGSPIHYLQRLAPKVKSAKPEMTSTIAATTEVEENFELEKATQMATPEMEPEVKDHRTNAPMLPFHMIITG